MIKLLLSLFLFLLLVAAPAKQPEAHPHGWIDLRSVMIFDDEGRVEAIRVHWLFDEYYTVFATEDMDADGDGNPDQDQIEALAENNITNLKDYDYFVYMKADGEQPAYGEVTHYETYMVGIQLAMVFTVPLAEPVDPKAVDFEYAVYDPTYWIEVLHVPGNPILIEGGAPEDCGYDLVLPNPDFETVSLAQALDRDETAGATLGQHFAERVVLTCGG